MNMIPLALSIQNCPESEQVGINPPRLLDMLVLKVTEAKLTTIKEKTLKTKVSLPSSVDERGPIGAMPWPLDRNVSIRRFRSSPEDATEGSQNLLELINMVLNLTEGFEIGLAKVYLLPLRAARTRDGYP